MSKEHIDLRHALLDQLERQTDETNKLMDQLMAEMDRARYSAATPQQSKDFRRRFLEIREQQRRLAERFLLETAALDNPASSTKQ